MINQQEWRKAISENKWQDIVNLSDEEIVLLISEDDQMTPSELKQLFDNIRSNQEVISKLLIFTGQEVIILKNLINILEDVHEFSVKDEPTNDLISKIKRS